tara:strand:- start:650 stop:853 length:204 start_codon:yes stop_codon:yes gene_type:complete
MFDLLLDELGKITEIVKMMEAEHGNKLTPESLMTQITMVENLQKVINIQLEVLKSQAGNIMTQGEAN